MAEKPGSSTDFKRHHSTGRGALDKSFMENRDQTTHYTNTSKAFLKKDFRANSQDPQPIPGAYKTGMANIITKSVRGLMRAIDGGKNVGDLNRSVE